MNILLLTPAMPYPPQQGASLRNYYILLGLASHHQVSLLSFAESDPTAAAMAHLKSLCATVDYVPSPGRSQGQRLKTLLFSSRPDMGHRLASPLFEAQLRRLLTHAYDIVQIEGIELVGVIPVIRQASPSSRIVFDNHNAETELQRRTALTDLRRPGRWPAAAYSLIQVGKLHRFERWACEAADAVTAVSAADAALLERLAPARRRPVTAIPNTIDVLEYPTPDRPPPRGFDLVFTGKMDFRPNVDAMRWFLRSVWPRILRVQPATTLGIVGQKPHPSLQAAARQGGAGVTLTGFVESVEPHIAGAAVFIMPLRMGSGTRLKLLEALAAGKAVVSTTLGAEGYDLKPGEHLLLADTPADFAAAVLDLLADSGRRAALGQAARAFAGRYDWRQIIPRFEILYRSLQQES